VKLTPERKQQFLAELARHGVLARAARSASPHSPDQSGALQTFRDERERDPAFAVEWDAALEQARAEVEYELYRRAQEGWEEPVFGGRYREQVVGSVRRYSDRLLELRARALLHSYRDAPAPSSLTSSPTLPTINQVLAQRIGQVVVSEAKALALEVLTLVPTQVGHAES
jgi:hypothetical protein